MTIQLIPYTALDSTVTAAFPGRNRLVNPFMSISQANEAVALTLTSGTVTVAGTGTADQWGAAFKDAALGGTTTVAQVTNDGPTSLGGGSGRSIKFLVGTGSATTASGDYAIFFQNIEAFNTTDLAFGSASAQAISLQFWVKSSITGTFSYALSNTSAVSAPTRAYVGNFTLSSTAWTQVLVPNIVGDTAGSWTTESNAVGLSLAICFYAGSAAGTSQTTSPNQWNTVSAITVGTSSNTNLLATNTNTFQIAGVQLETGSACTTLERRSFQQELALCQRYYEKTYDIGTTLATVTKLGLGILGAVGTGAATLVSTIQYKVTKRSAPSMSFWDSAGNSSKWTYVQAGSFTDNEAGGSISNIGFNGATFVNTSIVTGVLCSHWTADSRL